mmetsp:Transcript_26743/g.83224  ORF Transcript_26743/g.83224 Transcript_26743/m.83224 type:complete len:452 (-) Transcript_26743:24-1379(-)
MRRTVIRVAAAALLAVQTAALAAGADAARTAAFRALRQAARTPETLAQHSRALDDRDRTFARDLVAAADRHRSEIDAEIDLHCSKRPRGDTLAALRLGVVQIRYFDGVPACAAVHSAVEVCKRSRGSHGLVNAVLRKVVETTAESGPAGPPPLYDALATARGEGIANRFLKEVAKAPDRLQVTCASEAARDRFVEACLELGAAEKRGETGAAVRPRDRTAVDKLPGFAEGAWWVQDAGAAAAACALAAAVPKNSRVLDACAAPGGKALQLAAAGFDVAAVEKSKRRAARLRENLERCRAAADVVVADAVSHCRDEAAAGRLYDAILVDAPCSATGTARRRPDVLRSDPDLPALAATQAALLDAAWAALAPGGVLVFASCSALAADAEDAVFGFSARTPDASLAPLAPEDVDDAFDAEAFVDGCLRLWPWHLDGVGGCDAHFVARWRKNGAV